MTNKWWWWWLWQEFYVFSNENHDTSQTPIPILRGPRSNACPLYTPLNILTTHNMNIKYGMTKNRNAAYRRCTIQDFLHTTYPTVQHTWVSSCNCWTHFGFFPHHPESQTKRHLRDHKHSHNPVLPGRTNLGEMAVQTLLASFNQTIVKDYWSGNRFTKIESS